MGGSVPVVVAVVMWRVKTWRLGLRFARDFCGCSDFWNFSAIYRIDAKRRAFRNVMESGL